MNKQETLTCFICKLRFHITIRARDSVCFLCNYCHDYYFKDLSSEEEKIDRLIAAMKLANDKGLKLHYAFGVLKGKYGLREAKKLQNSKKRFKTGPAGDIFRMRRRRPGSFS